MERSGACGVDMGEPILEPAKIPTTLPRQSRNGRRRTANVPLDLGDLSLEVTCVSMGNPHCITFVDQLSDHWGAFGRASRGDRSPFSESHQRRVHRNRFRPRKFACGSGERGSGETLACGTGACAVCVAGALTGRIERKLLVHLPGGDLELDWAADNHVYLTGEAIEVFTGELEEG